MQNIIEVNYQKTGASTEVNAMGMRDMQARAYQKRGEQYLLLKAPPASGKSRALMYLALDKLRNRDVRKVIVAVPERTIGASFAKVKLTETGFFKDWCPDDRYNLCSPGGYGSRGKVELFKQFMASASPILICTHATLRFAFEQIATSEFNGCLLGIDEFHHVSADKDNSKLGALLHDIMRETDAHILAMTGSYFRGDNVAILMPEDEAKFTRVVYTYYDQLNGYKYLKSLGIGYHFYQGRYLDALPEILDTDKKTILHIPNVNSSESTKDKYIEVDRILDMIGDVVSEDHRTGVLNVRRYSDGKMIKVANLVEDDSQHRNKMVSFLRQLKGRDELDLIIALGMAKEGFDWPWCEHALTVGYRGSLTEIIQIIGRATRDCPGKEHTQFTNLVAAPAAGDDEITLAVNNMLKAVTASLLMEQVMAPDFKFKTRVDGGEKPLPGTVIIKGFKEPSTKRVRDIVENDLQDLKAQIFQDESVQKLIANDQADPRIVNNTLIPKIIAERYPNLNKDEVEQVRQAVVTDSAIKTGQFITETDPKTGQNREFIKMGEKFINVDDLSINLIDSINPFCGAFEIMSKQLTAPVLRLIRDAIIETRITLTLDEAVKLWPQVVAFIQTEGREPSPTADHVNENTLGQALILIKKSKRERGM